MAIQDRRVVTEEISVPFIDLAEHTLGAVHPRVTLEEYGEFECPHCGRAHYQLKALRERLPELGAAFVFRHLARDEVHPFSVRAAVAAEAAGLQGRFWEMHDHLFENQHSLEYEDLERHAAAIGLDVERFLRDMRDQGLHRLVRTQTDRALEEGITGTPTFLINGQRYDGGYGLEELVDAIALATQVV